MAFGFVDFARLILGFPLGLNGQTCPTIRTAGKTCACVAASVKWRPGQSAPSGRIDSHPSHPFTDTIGFCCPNPTVHQFDAAGNQQEFAFGTSDRASFSQRLAKVQGVSDVLSASSHDTLWGSADDVERRVLSAGTPTPTPTPTPTSPTFIGGPWQEIANPKNELGSNTLLKMKWDDVTQSYTACKSRKMGFLFSPGGDGQDLDGEFGQVFGPFVLADDPIGAAFKRIRLGDTTYLSFWVTTNGIVTFADPSDIGKKTSLNAFTSIPMVAPLFTKLNSQAIGNAKLNVKMKKNKIVVTWKKFVTKGKEHNKENRSVTMQVVLSKNGKVEFYYDELKVNLPAIVGISSGLSRSVQKPGEFDLVNACACGPNAVCP